MSLFDFFSNGGLGKDTVTPSGGEQSLGGGIMDRFGDNMFGGGIMDRLMQPDGGPTSLGYMQQDDQWRPNGALTMGLGLMAGNDMSSGLQAGLMAQQRNNQPPPLAHFLQRQQQRQPAVHPIPGPLY